MTANMFLKKYKLGKMFYTIFTSSYYSLIKSVSVVCIGYGVLFKVLEQGVTSQIQFVQITGGSTEVLGMRTFLNAM